MECTIKPYKLAWMERGKLLSSMHDTETEARQAESIIAAPTMVMKLQTMDGGNYSWVLLPGPWAWMAKNWLLIALAITALITFMLWKLNK